MRVDSAAVVIDGMPYLALVVDGARWYAGPELKGTVLMHGVVPVCVDEGAEPSAEMPADPADGRPHAEQLPGLTDDPVIYALAARYWLDVWHGRVQPGPVSVPRLEDAVTAAPLLRAEIREELQAANRW